MRRVYRNLRDCVFHNPLGISSLPPKFQRIANSYLPYKTGIEIECTSKRDDIYPLYISRAFRQVGCIDFSISDLEVRMQIPKGVEGMVTLYKSTLLLKENFGLNMLSGIHYHIDMNHHRERFIGPIREEYGMGLYKWGIVALKELESWNYNGSYNRKDVNFYSKHHAWVNYARNVGTIGNYTSEFRIGEMTFEYDILIKRIIHAQSLIKRSF